MEKNSISNSFVQKIDTKTGIIMDETQNIIEALIEIRASMEEISFLNMFLEDIKKL